VSRLNFSRLPAFRVGIALACFALMALAALALGGRAVPPPAAAPARASEEQLQVELITLTPRGFEPSTLTRPKGKFYLTVDNRSGSTEMNLRLDYVTGAQLREMRVSKELLDWSDLLELHPGEYLLTEADHPDWSCRITITPN